MEIRDIDIPDVKMIVPDVALDKRGYFAEAFNARSFEAAVGRVKFVQDNQSLSRVPYTIRGLHFQVNPSAQGKLIRVLQGSILDVVVDLRRVSAHYGKHSKVVLTAAGFEQLWIPIGFAHGFCTLEPDTTVLYKVTNFYDPECERGLRWNDPQLGIEWGVGAHAVTISAKDNNNPFLRELPAVF